MHMAELQQLRKGIRETLQMELPICMYPNEVHSLLVPSSSLKITTHFFLDEVIIDYSDHGSNKRTFEEAVILHWSDYIIDLPGKCYKLVKRVHFLFSRTKYHTSRRAKIYDWIDVFTSSWVENPPSISFTDADQLPTVSTCSLTLTFPRSCSKMSTDNFQQMMDLCILGSCGFGQV